MSLETIDVAIDAAILAIERDDLEAALAELIAAWRPHPCAAIARFVELIDYCLLGFASPGESPSASELLAANLVERGRLLRRLTGDAIEVADEPAWCDAFAALDPDPRLEPIFEQLSQQFALKWTEVAGDLEEAELDLSDPFTARFRAILVHHHADVSGIPIGNVRKQLDDATERRLLDAELVLRRRLFDDAGDRAAIAPFVDPADRSTLTAYGDWLTARGDPRGALLAWGAAANPQGLAWSVRELWLGPLGRFASAPMDDGWARVVRFHNDKDEAMTGLDWPALEIGWRPGWMAVEHLERPPGELLASVPLPALRILGCDRKHLATAVAANADLTDLDVLALRRSSATSIPSGDDVERLQKLLRAPQLRGLRELALHTYGENRGSADELAESLAPLLVDPCGLQCLTVYWGAREWIWVPAPIWLRALRAARSPLRRFRGTGGAGETWVFGHAGDGIDWTDVRVEWWTSSPNVYTADRVSDVARAGAEAITVVAKQPLTAPIEERLRRAEAAITIVVDPSVDMDRLG